MKIVFTENAWGDLTYWIENDMDKVKKVKELINAIQKNPFQGIGKPEPLRHQLKGYWSRRISQETNSLFGIQNLEGLTKHTISAHKLPHFFYRFGCFLLILQRYRSSRFSLN